MPVFIGLVVIVIAGIAYSKKQRAKQNNTIQSYSPYEMEQQPKKKNDLGGAFLFVIGIIAVIVIAVKAVPAISKGFNDKKAEAEASKNMQDTGVSLGKSNAVKAAKLHLSTFGMSCKGLVDQLKYEGYTDEEAQYGAENCGADWNEQAVISAKQHLAVLSMSRIEMIDQLIYEGFTQEQAEYAAKAVGYSE